MKNIIFSFIVCCSFLLVVRSFAQTAETQSGWYQLNSGVTSNLHCVFFPASESGNFGYVSGDSGILLKTVNGGNNWISVSPRQNVNFKTLYFLDAQTGWTAGWGNDSVFVFRTSDGGTNWTLQFAGYDVYNEPRCLSFSNLNKGYIGGAKRSSFLSRSVSGFDMLTTNGGLNWSKANSNVAILSVYFPTTDTAWRGAFYSSGSYTNGELHWTTNGGIYWDMTQNWESVYFYSVNFVGPLTGWAIGYNFGINPFYTLIYRTTNCGYWWNFNVIMTNTVFYSVYFITANRGWICGSEGVIKVSNNGGISWGNQSSSVTADLKSVTFTDINTGYAVGNNGVIIKTISGGLNGINNQNEVIKNFSLEQNYPNPFNPSTKIKFNIPNNLSFPACLDLSGNAPIGKPYVSLKVYDVLGKEISILVNEQLRPGTYEVNFDARNLPSGIYYYKLISGDFIQTRKMVLFK